jgi:predicted transcriptional regulator
MEQSTNEAIRNDVLAEVLIDMVEKGEHGLCVSDILVSFMNNRMLQEERDDILELLEVGLLDRITDALGSGGETSTYSYATKNFSEGKIVILDDVKDLHRAIELLNEAGVETRVNDYNEILCTI